jgi:DNA-binding transcriptional MerR regulator
VILYPTMPASSRDHTDSPFLTSEQVATILGVTKRTLKNWLRAGKIPEPERNPANNYRLWRPAHLDAIRSILREQQ